MSIVDYGWNEFFSGAYLALARPDLEPARLVQAGTGAFRLITDRGPCQAVPAGRLRHAAAAAADAPTVGDWVAIRPAGTSNALIEHVLPRRNRLSRKAPGRRTHEQVVAANVDTVFVVMGLDGDFNLRRLERLIVTVRESEARPIVVLNKSDLCADPAARLAEVRGVASSAPVVLTSCLRGAGVEALLEWIPVRETVVLIGSSGVGKSSLINGLLGSAVQKTAAVREGDDRGRHTTTLRQLFRLPGGGLLIDSPGIRELQLWGRKSSLTEAFDDIAGLAEGCRFRDCRHLKEQGCAVLAAVEDGRLDRSRLESHRGLKKELHHLELRQNEAASRVEKSKWRAIHREMRKSGKHRPR